MLKGGALVKLARGNTALSAATTPAPANWEEWQEKEPAYITTPCAGRYSSEDWLYNLFTLASSYMTRRVFSHVLAGLVVSTLVWASYAFWFPAFKTLCAGLTTVPHSLTAGALGLLLVFRTNTAYDRFWEARKLWGALVNTVRDNARMAHVHLRGYERDHYLACLACFPSILLQHLQKLEPIYRPTLLSKTQVAAISGSLGETDLNLLWKSRNRPFTLIKMMGAILYRNGKDFKTLSERYNGGDRGEKLNEFEILTYQAAQINERNVMEKDLTEFCNQMGACERIVKSSVPTSYSRHTSRFLTMWCLTLPMVLVHSLKWKMIPCVAILSWMLFVIEEVGHVIEDPFNVHVMLAGSGQEDELRIEASLGVLRGDSFERIPASSPHLMKNQGNFITDENYDTAQFHQDWLDSAKK